MHSFYLLSAKFTRAAFLVCLCAPLFIISAQQKQSRPTTTTTPQQQADDIVRISTDLVQTDVTVLDKQGRFVDNLQREQFELLVDGKPQQITFFERVAAGSTSEETQIAAARGTSVSGEKVQPLDRGRTIFFFVDDLHMASDSLIRTRKSLTQFIENEMGQNDQVAITSTSGQVGFLQQLTDNKIVLRAAIKRLTSSSQLIQDPEQPPMPELLALAIDLYNDPDVIDYFVQPLVLKGTPRAPAEEMVKGRAKRILRQAAYLTRTTLATLEDLARSSLPGRKLVFFISDGFLLNNNESDINDRIRTITNSAARNGVIIYSLDPRGLAVVGAGDALNTMQSSTPDARGINQGAILSYSTRELSATQEPLRMIAANTGGRAYVNSNSLQAGFTKAIQETSVYYLIAWRPETEAQRKDKFRQIEVRVTGRKDLNVQVRRGFYDVAAKPSVKTEKTEKVTAPRTSAKEIATRELREAISSPYPTYSLPTQLGLVYTIVPDKGAMLTASIQIARQFMTFDHQEDKQTALLDLTGVVLNDQGKLVASFGDHLNVAVYFPKYVGQPRRDLVYNFQSQLKPGLYQVRVAARDFKSGRTGSAMQWIQIPDLASHKLTLSSLVLSETTKEAESRKSGSTELADSFISADHRLDRTSKLRFMTFVYNAARNGTQPPDVTIQVQILRDDQPVVTTALRKVQNNDADPSRLAYGAEIPLEALIPGRYVLQVTVIDRIAKESATERASFEVE